MAAPPLDRRVVVIAILAAFVAFLDGSIINVALPAMSAELGGGLPVQQWIVNAYLITLGAFILLAGSLSDLFGRIAIMRIGLIAFALTSIACGLAPTAELLIAARAAQGLAGALLVPSSLALIVGTHRGVSQAKAIGIWTAWTSAAFIVGPLLGGLLTDFLSWRWVFFINVLPVAITLVLMATMRNEPAAVRTPIDIAGAILGAIGLGGVAFVLIEQVNYGWDSPLIIGSLIVGVLSLVSFLFREFTARHPMMPLSLFRNRNFAAGNLATVAIYAALSISTLVIVLYLQEVAGLSATASGLVTLPITVTYRLQSARYCTLAGRYGPRWFMTAGPILAGGGMMLLLAIDEPFDFVTQALLGIVVFGLGIAVTVAPLTSAVLGAIEPTRAGIASAVNNAVSRIAGLMAIATLGVVVGAVIDGAWLDRALIFSAILMVIGGVVSAIGIRNPIAAHLAAADDAADVDDVAEVTSADPAS